MLAKVIGLSKGGVVSAQKVLAYLGRDGADQAHELAQFGAPEMGAINSEASLITAEDRLEVANLWDYMVSCSPGIRSNPFYHVALNWQEGEHPDKEQVQEACFHAMHALGMEGCDAVWAIHRDTDNAQRWQAEPHFKFDLTIKTCLPFHTKPEACHFDLEPFKCDHVVFDPAFDIHLTHIWIGNTILTGFSTNGSE